MCFFFHYLLEQSKCNIRLRSAAYFVFRKSGFCVVPFFIIFVVFSVFDVGEFIFSLRRMCKLS